MQSQHSPVPIFDSKGLTPVKADGLTDTVWINHQFIYIFVQQDCILKVLMVCVSLLMDPLKIVRFQFGAIRAFIIRIRTWLAQNIDLVRRCSICEINSNVNENNWDDLFNNVEIFYSWQDCNSQCWKWLGKQIFANQIFIITGLHISAFLALSSYWEGWLD